MEKKYVFYNGLKFTRDEKTGYYLNSTFRKRLHRYIWESHHGVIPEGFHIHHVDGNKSNNDISNLQLLSGVDHLYLHGKEVGNIIKMKETVQPLGTKRAVEWHASEEGLKWHKEHYANTKDRLHRKEKKNCQHCGEEYETVVSKANFFCSGKCKSAARRESGIDNEERSCEHCGKSFITNKYSKTRFCSKSCSNKGVVRLPQLKNKDIL